MYLQQYRIGGDSLGLCAGPGAVLAPPPDPYLRTGVMGVQPRDPRNKQLSLKKAKLPRSAHIFHCDSCGMVLDRDLNAAKNLAALAELAFDREVAKPLVSSEAQMSKVA